MKNALVSSLALGAIATFGDWIWATFLSRHLMGAGLVHGGLLCLAMGAAVGRPVGRAGGGAAFGLAIGVTAAGLFYLLAPLVRFGAMLPAWFALWVMLALLYHRLAQGTSLGLAMARGVIAGAASGLAFYLVSDMWTEWNPRAIHYLDHFARWTFAFAPGFLALQGGARPLSSER
ncbi:MAG: hypothetical protein ACRD26_20725 [Vicinamibacterales bacterium]